MRILIVVLIAGCAVLPAALCGQTAGARNAEAAIKSAQRRMVRVYESQEGRRLQRSCDELAGQDCFGGQHECVKCPSWPTRPEMIALGAAYDSAAALVVEAREQVAEGLLDWLAGQQVGVWARLGQLERARAAVQQCRAMAWWCTALRG
ncbi:MAG: hypothetical protein ACREMA_18920, partial [Longimicrobiales bacterium]